MGHVIRSLGTGDRHCFFWGVHTGAELDLVIEDGRQLLGFEFKRTLSPKLTRSMTRASETLRLTELTVVYPGKEAYSLADSVAVQPLTSFRKRH